MTDSRGKILVVDDDPGSQKSLRRILGMDNYEVELASTVAECLERRDWHGYLAVLLDRKLGDGNAEDVLPHIRKLAPEIPVIIITGYADLESSIEALRAGASDYIIKPINPEMLRKTLQRMARQRSTEASLAEKDERYRALVDAAPLCIFETTLEGQFESMNLHGRERMGLTAAEDVRCLHLHDEVVPEDREKTLEYFQVATRGEPVHFEFSEEGPEGRRRMSTNLTPIRNVEGEVVRIMGICEDVTERKQLQEEYFQAQKMEAVGRLASGIAHDFNNLLAGLIAACGIAIRKLGPDHPAREILQEAETEGMRGAQMARQLLDFSRQGVQQAENISLREVALGTEKVLRRLLGEDIDFRVVLSDSKSFIWADRGRMEQVLMNLAVNARDAMPRGGSLTIEVSDTLLSEEDAKRRGNLKAGPHVTVLVTDTGEGMNEETLAKAFDPFFTTKKVGRGTGLGLSSVAGIVRAASGHIDLKSEPGQGTTVRLLFPQSDRPQSEVASEPIKPVERGTNETVLVVEDERLIRAGIRELLKGLGYRVLDVGSPKEALELVRSHAQPIDLLLTDIVLPGMNGPELAEKLLDEFPTLRIVYMSAFTGDALVEQGRLAAGLPVLEKPFTEEELAEKVSLGLSSKNTSPRK